MANSDFISREAAIEACKSATDRYEPIHSDIAIECAVTKIKQVPAADVRAVVKGTWMQRGTLFPMYECDKCNAISMGGNFCPNCGADMRQLDKLFIAARGISKSRTVLRATMKAMGWSDAEIAEIERKAERNVKGESNDG